MVGLQMEKKVAMRSSSQACASLTPRFVTLWSGSIRIRSTSRSTIGSQARAPDALPLTPCPLPKRKLFRLAAKGTHGETIAGLCRSQPGIRTRHLVGEGRCRADADTSASTPLSREQTSPEEAGRKSLPGPAKKTRKGITWNGNSCGSGGGASCAVCPAASFSSSVRYPSIASQKLLKTPHGSSIVIKINDFVKGAPLIVSAMYRRDQLGGPNH